jgi:hypothetical protein
MNRASDVDSSLGRDLDSDGLVQTCSLQFGDLGRHGSREKVGVSFLRNHFQDLVDDRSEIHIQQSISFIHDLLVSYDFGSVCIAHEVFERFQRESLSVFQMIHQSTGSGDDNVWPL